MLLYPELTPLVIFQNESNRLVLSEPDTSTFNPFNVDPVAVCEQQGGLHGHHAHCNDAWVTGASVRGTMDTRVTECYCSD
jgi:hypothetical protein